MQRRKGGRDGTEKRKNRAAMGVDRMVEWKVSVIVAHSDILSLYMASIPQPGFTWTSVAGIGSNRPRRLAWAEPEAREQMFPYFEEA